MNNVIDIKQTNFYEERYLKLTRRLNALQLACERGDKDISSRVQQLARDFPMVNNGYHVYRLETGATYWFGAPSLAEAMKLVADVAQQEQWEDDMSVTDISRMTDEEAMAVELCVDGRYHDAYSLAVLLNEPNIIGCSEW